MRRVTKSRCLVIPFPEQRKTAADRLNMPSDSLNLPSGRPSMSALPQRSREFAKPSIPLERLIQLAKFIE